MEDANSGTSLHRQLLSAPAHQQPDCPLLRVPAEIRRHIFTLALVDYEEPAADQQYAKDSCWARPSYNSPRRTDIALLQTCRSVYREAWFLAFMVKEQTHWITSSQRAPPEYKVNASPDALCFIVKELREQYKQPVVEIESLRIFTQMFMLEGGDVLAFLGKLHEHGLAFRRLYLTIRHADFWLWEDDEPLRFEGAWIPELCEALPSTLREVVVEMETVKRKTAQLDDLANQMTRQWHFRTSGGGRLFADSTPNSCEVSRWQGSSAWHNQRWIRDEVSEGAIEYHVAAVRFRPRHAIEKAGGAISGKALQAAASEPFVEPEKLHLPNAEPMECEEAWIRKDTGDG